MPVAAISGIRLSISACVNSDCADSATVTPSDSVKVVGIILVLTTGTLATASASPAISAKASDPFLPYIADDAKPPRPPKTVA